MPSTVQDNLSTGILQQFHISIGTSLINKLQDWPTRQKIAYESMKGLMKDDWLGLQDFQVEMSRYSSTHIILRLAYATIQYMIPLNQRIAATLVTIPGMGLVGRFLLTLSGFQSVFIAPPDILQNSDQLNSTITSLT